MIKQPWNIWRIKNRWLRAVFTLVFMSPVLVGAVILTAAIAIVVGIGEGAAYAWHVFTGNRDVKVVGRAYWLAITLKEAA